MPSFIGQWTTTRYSGNDPANPEMITLTITADADPNALDGAYPRPGEDARLFGPLDATGLIWTARIDERNSSGDVLPLGRWQHDLRRLAKPAAWQRTAALVWNPDLN